MAGGIDWFRWHHGSVTDPKFRLVAKKARARFGDVITIWAFVLEAASADAERGTIGQLDFETLDDMLDAEEGTAARILDAMAARGLVDGNNRIAAWDKRQPKREDDTAAERKRRQREREHEMAVTGNGVTEDVSRDVTHGHADVTHGHDREEESREEKKKRNTPPTPRGGAVDVPEWVPAEPWTEFVQMRRAKGQRTPFTVGAAKGVITKLATLRDAGIDLAEVLRQSTVNGWADVYEPKPNKVAAASGAVAEPFL
jgi:hypothetical protein